MQICGNVYVDNSYKNFMFKCLYCLNDIDIDEYKDFVQHIQANHASKDEEPFIDIFNNPLQERICVEEIKAENLLSKENLVEDSIAAVVKDAAEIKSEKEEEEQGENELHKADEKPILTSHASDSDYDDKNDEGVSDSESDDCASDSSGSDYEVSKVTSNKLNVSLLSTNRNTRFFIEACKQHPCLWHPEDPHFKKTKSVAAAFSSVRDEMKLKTDATMTLGAIKNAFKKLIAQYRQLSAEPNSSNSKVAKENMELCSFLKSLSDEEQHEEENEAAWRQVNFLKVNQPTAHFIEILKKYPALYDQSHADFEQNDKRMQFIAEMLDTLKAQHKMEMSGKQLELSIRKVLVWNYKLRSRLEKTGKPIKLNKTQKHFIEKCKFLPKAKIQVLKKLPCEECGKIFATENTLQAHLYREHKKGTLPFKCAHCERSFELKCQRTMHEQRSHIERAHQCEHCERRFSVLIDLQRHVLTHSGKKPFVCEHCGKGFRLKTSLGYHVTAMHTKIRAYKCDRCPKDFKKPVDLRDHIKAHLDIRDKICETCGKGFTNCHSLIRHRQIHSAVKKFACKLCDAKFHQFVGLNSHMKRTHGVVKNKPTTELSTD